MCADDGDNKTFAYLALTVFSSSDCASSGKSGSAYPFACNSFIASLSWGTDAEIFGNFMMLASGVLANCPSSVSASPMRWSSFK